MWISERPIVKSDFLCSLPVLNHRHSTVRTANNFDLLILTFKTDTGRINVVSNVVSNIVSYVVSNVVNSYVALLTTKASCNIWRLAQGSDSKVEFQPQLISVILLSAFAAHDIDKKSPMRVKTSIVH